MKEKWPLRKLVEVEWIDSCVMGKWQSKEAYLNHEPARIRTAGYLLKYDKHKITIIQSQDCQGAVSDSMTIPRRCLKTIRRLEKVSH